MPEIGIVTSPSAAPSGAKQLSRRHAGIELALHDRARAQHADPFQAALGVASPTAGMPLMIGRGEIAISSLTQNGHP